MDNNLEADERTVVDSSERVDQASPDNNLEEADGALAARDGNSLLSSDRASVDELEDQLVHRVASQGLAVVAADPYCMEKNLKDAGGNCRHPQAESKLNGCTGLLFPTAVGRDYI